MEVESDFSPFTSKRNTPIESLPVVLVDLDGSDEAPVISCNQAWSEEKENDLCSIVSEVKDFSVNAHQQIGQQQGHKKKKIRHKVSHSVDISIKDIQNHIAVANEATFSPVLLAHQNDDQTALLELEEDVNLPDIVQNSPSPTVETEEEEDIHDAVNANLEESRVKFMDLSLGKRSSAILLIDQKENIDEVPIEAHSPFLDQDHNESDDLPTITNFHSETLGSSEIKSEPEYESPFLYVENTQIQSNTGCITPRVRVDSASLPGKISSFDIATVSHTDELEPLPFVLEGSNIATEIGIYHNTQTENNDKQLQLQMNLQPLDAIVQPNNNILPPQKKKKKSPNHTKTINGKKRCAPLQTPSFVFVSPLVSPKRILKTNHNHNRSQELTKYLPDIINRDQLLIGPRVSIDEPLSSNNKNTNKKELTKAVSHAGIIRKRDDNTIKPSEFQLDFHKDGFDKQYHLTGHHMFKFSKKLAHKENRASATKHPEFIHETQPSAYVGRTSNSKQLRKSKSMVVRSEKRRNNIKKTATQLTNLTQLVSTLNGKSIFVKKKRKSKKKSTKKKINKIPSLDEKVIAKFPYLSMEYQMKQLNDDDDTQWQYANGKNVI